MEEERWREREVKGKERTARGATEETIGQRVSLLISFSVLSFSFCQSTFLLCNITKVNSWQCLPLLLLLLQLPELKLLEG